MTMKWNTMTLMQKIGTIITFIGAALVLIAIVKPDLFPVRIDSTLAIAIMTLGETLDRWEKQRKWAYLLLGATVICLACFLLGLFL